MTPSPVQGRVCLVLAALLWSLSGGLTRVLQRDAFGLNEPRLTPLQIAFYRALFAGLVFLPMLRRREATFRPLMPAMVVCFAAMNALFLSAVAGGPSANAIFLQCTAPLWVYLILVFGLGEPSDGRSLAALAVGLVGMGVIVAGSFDPDAGASLDVTAMGLGSGVLYAFVVVCLRALRRECSFWLTVLNHLGTAVCLGGAVLLANGAAGWLSWATTPTAGRARVPGGLRGGADGVAVPALRAGAAGRRPAGGRGDHAAGAGAEPGLGLPGVAGDRHAAGDDVGRRRDHPVGASVAVSSAKKVMPRPGGERSGGTLPSGSRHVENPGSSRAGL